MYKDPGLRHEPAQCDLVLSSLPPELSILSTAPPSLAFESHAFFVNSKAGAEPLPNNQPLISNDYVLGLCSPPSSDDLKLSLTLFLPDIPNVLLENFPISEPPAGSPAQLSPPAELSCPAELSPPSLLEALAGLSGPPGIADRPLIQRQALHEVMAFFTFCTPSAADWEVLLASCFFLTINALFSEEADAPLAICCLHSALSHALSSVPTPEMHKVLFELAPGLLGLFGTATSADECLSAYFDIGAEIMVLTRDRRLADDILSGLSGAILSHVQNSGCIGALPDLWWLIHEWFSCGPAADVTAIGFVTDGLVVPALCAFPSDDLPGLDVNLIRVIGDACMFIEGFAGYVIESGFPQVLRDLIVASPRKRLTRASVEVLYHLAGIMKNAPRIAPASVDALLDQVPELAHEIVELALLGLASSAASDPGVPAGSEASRPEGQESDPGVPEECDASRPEGQESDSGLPDESDGNPPAHQEYCVSQEFWDQRAAWARKHVQDSPVAFSVSVRCFCEAVRDGEDLLNRVDPGALIPRLCDLLLSDPSHEERMGAVHLLLGYASTNRRSVCAFLQEHCSPYWFDQIRQIASEEPDREGGTEFEEGIEVLSRAIHIDLDIA
jgi:hypothetical protein